MKLLSIIIIASVIIAPAIVFIDSYIFGGEPKNYLTASIMEMTCFFGGMLIALLSIKYDKYTKEKVMK